MQDNQAKPTTFKASPVAMLITTPKEAMARVHSKLRVSEKQAIFRHESVEMLKIWLFIHRRMTHC